MVDVTTEVHKGTTIVFIGTSHWELSPVIDALEAAEPDIVCAEARPTHGFDSRHDQQAVQTELKRRGTPVVMMDSEARTPTKQEAIERYGEETLEQVDNAGGRDEIEEVAPEFYQEICDRENAMVERVRGTLDRHDIQTIAVVVGSVHVEAIRSRL